MIEIEEIAEQASIDTLGRISPAFEIGYIVGTNDAINKACEWIKYSNENGGCLFDNWEKSFRKAMKGE